MENQELVFYLIDKDRSVREVDTAKFRVSYSNDSHITIEDVVKDSERRIVIRGYYGNDEYSHIPTNVVVFQILPHACNQITIRPELYNCENNQVIQNEPDSMPQLYIIGENDESIAVPEQELVIDFGNERCLEIIIGTPRRSEDIFITVRQKNTKRAVLLHMLAGGCNLVTLSPEFK